MYYQEQEVGRADWQTNLRKAVCLSVFHHKLDRNQVNIRLQKLTIPLEESSEIFFSELKRIGIKPVAIAVFNINFNEPPKNLLEPEREKWIYTARVTAYKARIGVMDGVIIELSSEDKILGFSFSWNGFDSSPFLDMSHAKSMFRRTL